MQLSKNRKVAGYGFLIIMLLFVFSFFPMTMFADEEDIHLEVVSGIAGEYKWAKWVPIHVTITNMGEDIEGNLQVDITADFPGRYYQPVAVAKGSVKKVTLLVPGQGLNASTKVQFVVNGQEIASQKIGGRNLGHDTMFIGVLASDPNTANYLATMPKNVIPVPVRVVPLKAEDIPTFSKAMDTLDMLVINNYSLDQLSKEQLESIQDWTQQGGILVVGGGAHYDKSAASLQAISPVQVSGTTTVQKLDSLVVDGGKPLELSKPFTLSKATQWEGQVYYQENDIPLIVLGEAGKGKVLYVAYDLAEEPMASWQGNGQLWAKTFNRMLNGNFYNMKMGMEYGWALQNASDRIPSLKLPNISTLAIIFSIYILLVGPILYFILKRFEKREWVWFIVPALACLMAIGIYLYGSNERSDKVLAHNISYLELKEQYADLTASAAIFVPKSGDYKLQFTDGSTATPSHYNYYGPYQQNQEPDTMISISPEYSELQFKNVEFWAIRKAMLQKSTKDVGNITSNLMYKDGKLVGTVTNETQLRLRDVKVFNGRHVQDLDVLEPGATTEIEINFDTSIRPGTGMIPIQDLLPNHIKQLGQNQMYGTREQMMMDLLNMSYYGHGYNPNQIVMPVTLIGWTEDPLVHYEIESQEVNALHLALVKSELKIQPSEDGYVFFPGGTFEAMLVDNPGHIDYTGDGYMVQNGDITLEFTIRKEGLDIEIDKLQLYTWSNDRTNFDKQVYNWQTKQFDNYKDAFDGSKLQGDKVKTYISPEGQLRIKMTHNMDGYRHLGQPAINVEGKVTKK